jgi:hypothetical protein
MVSTRSTGGATVEKLVKIAKNRFFHIERSDGNGYVHRRRSLGSPGQDPLNHATRRDPPMEGPQNFWTKK